MEIIKATLNELDIISNLFDLYRQFYNQQSDIAAARIFLSERINKNESVIFLAVVEKINIGIGFVQLYPSFSSVSMKRSLILNDLFVHENFREQGIAKALIERAISYAIETKANGLALETQISNVSAQRLYDKKGFKKDDEHYYYYLTV